MCWWMSVNCTDSDATWELTYTCTLQWIAHLAWFEVSTSSHWTNKYQQSCECMWYNIILKTFSKKICFLNCVFGIFCIRFEHWIRTILRDCIFYNILHGIEINRLLSFIGFLENLLILWILYQWFIVEFELYSLWYTFPLLFPRIFAPFPRKHCTGIWFLWHCTCTTLSEILRTVCGAHQ